MAANNLRVVFKNLVDNPANQLTVSSTASATTTAANMINDYKGYAWRSAQTSTTVSDTLAVIRLVCDQPSPAGVVVLAYTNLKVGTLVRVRGYLGPAPTINTGTANDPVVVEDVNSTLMFDSGFIDCMIPAALGQFQWGLDSLGLMGNDEYSNYTTVWLDDAHRIPCTTFIIEVQNRGNSDGCIKVGKLIVGDYWCPQFNTSYGADYGIIDSTQSERTEAGDLISSVGSKHKTMSFDLEFMSVKDRSELNRIIKYVGTSIPIFVSIFPENSNDYIKEQVYEIYGKFTQLSNIAHSMYDTYSTQLELEEV